MNSSSHDNNEAAKPKLDLPDLLAWQKQLLDERLTDYRQIPSSSMDFDKTLDDIEKGLAAKNIS